MNKTARSASILATQIVWRECAVEASGFPFYHERALTVTASEWFD